MATLYYRKNESLAEILDKIADSSDQEIELQCDPEVLLWQNSENKAILEAYAVRLDKKLTLSKQSVTPEDKEETPEKEIVSSSIEVTKTGKHTVGKRAAWFSYPRILILLALLFVLVASSALAGGIYYLPRAEVQLTVAKQTVAEQATIILRLEQESSDSATMTLPATQEQVVQETSKEFQTTGKQIVGETATGSIVIYNWTDVSVQLPVGQIFKVNAGQEGAGMEYKSKDQVTVPPREEVTQGPGEKSTTAGSATVAVEASVLGAEYNLAANLFFTVNGYGYGDDGLQGINPTAFSGGTTEEISVLAQSDIDSAQTELRQTLEAIARDKIKEKAGGVVQLVDESITSEILSVQFDKKVGEEASTVNGRMTLRVTAQVFNEDELKELMVTVLINTVPEGFELADDEIFLTSAFAGTSAEGFSQMSVRAEALVLPKLDETVIKENIAGKTTEEAQAYIQGLERVSEGTVTLHPKILAFMKRLPFRSDRISIIISEE